MTTQSPASAGPTEFLSDNLPTASFLASRGHPVTLTAGASGRVLFHFPQTPTLAEDLAALQAGEARVEPAAYDAARISLRRQMDALRGAAR